MLAGCATKPVPIASAPLPARGYQWLHGSGEAALISRTAYEAMAGFVEAAQAARKAGRPIDGAVLATDASPQAPAWTACGDKPSAVVLDMDETSVLNTGANYDAARRGDPPFDAKRWDAWERGGAAYVEPLPGAVAAFARFRAAGVTPVVITNRRSANAGGAIAALAQAGLGDFAQGDTLFLAGDVAPGSGKDPRRAFVASRYCVLAMAGDQLGDFSDLFNARTLAPQSRRALALSPAIGGKWGHGWFLMPNPLYGPGIAGGFDDIFPAAVRWPGPDGDR